ncbi:MAG: heavy-metal-associated domain-containing protein [Melioribacteraceae bacterium]|nr:heavy-metal-associated domain-containing protein [Melioribacteraceae bacterium]MCF8356814.1 heavy-metal-associated domain-containing protein [Melioribacteraceae bacterium]MCF8394261.1 heavy-metal-associated domain-containing protein [Melioribacteraceae bacterium]MCF8418161.1 heavy-metal-associated domain-containing protein [Melioribacteraceae bacterium]
MEQTFKIDGMSCNHCVMALKKELSELALDFFDVEIGTAKVRYDVNKVKHEDIVSAIKEAGYKVIAYKDNI